MSSSGEGDRICSEPWRKNSSGKGFPPSSPRVVYSARAVFTLYEDERGSRKGKREGIRMEMENVKGAGEERTRRIVRTGRMIRGRISI